MSYKPKFVVKMNVVRISSKGQIVIPAKLRKELGLEVGDRLIVDRRENAIILKPVVKLSKLRGVDKLKGVSREVDEIRKEWDREFDEVSV